MPQNSLFSLYPMLFHPPGLLLLHFYFFPSIELHGTQSSLSGRIFLIKLEVPCGPSNLLPLQVVIRSPYAVKLLNLTLIPLISLWFPWQQAFYHSLPYIPILSYIISTQWKKSLDCTEHTSHRSKDKKYIWAGANDTYGQDLRKESRGQGKGRKMDPEGTSCVTHSITHLARKNCCTTTKSNRSWIMAASVRLPKLPTVEIGIASWFTNICEKLYKRCLVMSFS